jgi:hypothetical protein
VVVLVLELVVGVVAAEVEVAGWRLGNGNLTLLGKAGRRICLTVVAQGFLGCQALW